MYASILAISSASAASRICCLRCNLTKNRGFFNACAPNVDVSIPADAQYSSIVEISFVFSMPHHRPGGAVWSRIIAARLFGY